MYTIAVTMNGAARWEDSFFRYDRAALDETKAAVTATSA